MVEIIELMYFNVTCPSLYVVISQLHNNEINLSVLFFKDYFYLKLLFYQFLRWFRSRI